MDCFPFVFQFPFFSEDLIMDALQLQTPDAVGRILNAAALFEGLEVNRAEVVLSVEGAYRKNCEPIHALKTFQRMDSMIDRSTTVKKFVSD